jgi:histidinol-phosphate aminotransferase
MDMEIDNYIRSSVRDMKPYSTETTRRLDMSTNTNLIGADPACKKVLMKLTNSKLNQYPTQNSDNLRNVLAKKHQYKPENFIVGNGSDEILDLVAKAFINPGDAVVYPTPSFSMYGFFTTSNLGRVVTIKLKNNFQLDAKKMISANGKITTICNPNNPTGKCFEKKDVYNILENAQGIVLIDEAYAEFSHKSFIEEIENYNNLIITRTFSKAYGLASIRVGYAVSNEKIIGILNRIKPPYNLNAISETIAVEALKSDAFLNKTIRTIDIEKKELYKKLKAIGTTPHLSDANFILVKLPVNSKTFCKKLEKEGILIKDVGGLSLLENHVRITVGTRMQNKLLIGKMSRVLAKMKSNDKIT